jgi:hypothetical protein
MGAESNIPRDGNGSQADGSDEPLQLGVDQADRSHRAVREPARQTGEGGQGRVRCIRVKAQCVEHLQAFSVVEGNGGQLHSEMLASGVSVRMKRLAVL